jgi:hypothetical protein
VPGIESEPSAIEKTWNQALKSIGAGSGGTPISPRYPAQYRAGMFMQRQSVMARCAKSRHTLTRS